MSERPQPETVGRAGALRAWLGWWALCAACWMLLVDRPPLQELVAGAVVATGGATGAVLVRSQRPWVLRPRLRWLTGAARPLLGLVSDLPPLVAALWARIARGEPVAGTYTELAYPATGADGVQAAHRVLTASFGSLAANTIVVDVDDDRDVLIAHQLVPRGSVAAKALPLPGPPPGGAR